MALSTIAKVDELLSDAIASQSWYEIDPRQVIEGAEDKDAKARYDVRAIPEADISAICTRIWWIPWHDDEIELSDDVKDQHKVPCSECWSR